MSDNKKTPEEARAWIEGWRACEAEVIEALEGAPQSLLFGEHGLIAATMRCVHTLQQFEDIIYPSKK